MSQNGERAQVLEMIRERFGGCGYIKRNGRRDGALVYVVRRRRDLLTRVIPFFGASPLLSSKQAEFEKFSDIVWAMAEGHHRTRAGFLELLERAVSMNGNGRFRKQRWLEVIAGQPESSETVRQTELMLPKIQSELHGDMQSQAEMPWPSITQSGRE